VWITATPNTLNVADSQMETTAPPTITFTPTPIPDPRELIDEADRILRNG
jgi:hypothetical protein